MHHASLLKNRSKINDLREIPCFPIKHVLRYLNVTDVDIWVLDTEGAELAVLRGADFDAVSFKLILMECDGHDPTKDEEKEQ